MQESHLESGMDSDYFSVAMPTVEEDLLELPPQGPRFNLQLENVPPGSMDWYQNSLQRAPTTSKHQPPDDQESSQLEQIHSATESVSLLFLVGVFEEKARPLQ